jgi:hypothetical protein
MSVAFAAKVFRHFLLEGDPSNKPLEWTGLQQLSAPPPQAPLPATQGQRWMVVIVAKCTSLI